jgi:hypothetical protein
MTIDVTPATLEAMADALLHSMATDHLCDLGDEKTYAVWSEASALREAAELAGDNE